MSNIMKHKQAIQNAIELAGFNMTAFEPHTSTTGTAFASRRKKLYKFSVATKNGDFEIAGIRKLKFKQKS